MDAPPNQTLYLQNVYEKLKKDDTKRILYALFGQFGKVIDVVVLKTTRLRGQAWVVYADVSSASNALRGLNDFPFFDRPLKLQYARTKSDAVAKFDGSWRKDKRTRLQQPGIHAISSAAVPKESANRPSASALPPGHVEDVGEPNSILFIENLPEATTADMLAVLFKQFPGFQEARLVHGKPGIAFVDFSTDMQAGVAISGLQGFKLTPQHYMKVVYAKR